MSNGVLFDVRSGRELHQFDLSHQTFSGVFHPNGWEIVTRSRVWDIRTFRLLGTVPELRWPTFSVQNVIYVISCIKHGLAQRFRRSRDRAEFETFQVLNSSDYSSIITVNVGRRIYDLKVNKHGMQIALVENSVLCGQRFDSILRIYDVGRYD
ncbi:Protein mahjong [Pseudolycoriella hygida]|uniref:Protein mahjong n=1 Tax=Pseudolycoriella hygida TaxID=35572 RepID=A0A9Q0N948_9DIPT|nr:Protein mahjong [Pseudolycoriella hygida]